LTQMATASFRLLRSRWAFMRPHRQPPSMIGQPDGQRAP
jgi:hypothetical protein